MTNEVIVNMARTYLQLPLRQWGTGNVYLLVLSSWKVNIAKKPTLLLNLPSESVGETLPISFTVKIYR